MSSLVFGQEYSDQYDLLYGDKDYDAECDMLEGALQRFRTGPVKAILDLGCGTGNHAIPLARRGYQVTGIDRSPEMLTHALEKARLSPPPTPGSLPVFLRGDVRWLSLDKEFDAVLMMFAVLGYQLTNADVHAALHTVQTHLCPRGVFICDVWYGPAVLAIRPSDRLKVIPTEDGQVIRAASGALDTFHHLAEVRYHIWRLSGKQLVSETQEDHQMRYFFPMELAYFLEDVGLEMKSLTAFPTLDAPADETSWNVLVVAQRGQ